MQVNLLTGIAKLLQLAALLFFLIALGASYWVESGSNHIGLFEYCIGSCEDVDSECKLNGAKVTTECDALNAVRAFTFLAMFFAAITSVLALIFIFKGTESFKVAVPALAAVSGICGLIAMAIYADKFEPPTGADYGYAFGLLVAGWVIELVSAPLFFVGAGKSA